MKSEAAYSIRQDWLDYLKAYAIIMVVLGHSVHYYGIVNLNSIEILLYSIVTTVHVPLFFVCSGYLCKKQPLNTYYKKKIFRIIIPFITFVIFKLIYGIFISSEFTHSKSVSGQIINAFMTGSLYWFIYAIFIMYIIAPFFWRGDVKRRLYVTFFILFIVNTVLGNCEINKVWDIEIFQIGRVLFFFIYFIVGMICKCNENLINKIKNKPLYTFFSTLMIVALSYGVYNKYNMNQFLTKVLLSLSLMYLLYILTVNMPKNISFLKIVGKYSVQIYFFDSFFKVILFTIFGKFMTITLFVSIIIAIINIILSCLVCEIIRKIPYIRIMFGL